MTTLTQYAKAAQHLPMSWLTQAEFPDKDRVKQSFKEALEELAGTQDYEDAKVIHALMGIVNGTDPRGGTFKAQAIYAAAQLHDRVTALALAPKVKKPKVRAGSVLHGYCGGLLDDSYGHRIVLSRGKGWINCLHMDGDAQGQSFTYRGNLKELTEFLVPDHHCPDNCTKGQD